MSDVEALNDLLGRLLDPFARSIAHEGRAVARLARHEFDAIFQEFCEARSIAELDRPKLRNILVEKLKVRITKGD